MQLSNVQKENARENVIRYGVDLYVCKREILILEHYIHNIYVIQQ